MTNYLPKIIALGGKLLLIYWLGLVLGLGSFDPDSHLLWQNWKVWLLVYLPLAIGLEDGIVGILKLAKKKPVTGDRKRYLLFVVPEYYPNGGLADVMASFDSAAEAIEFVSRKTSVPAYVWDRIDDVEIWSNVGKEAEA